MRLFLPLIGVLIAGMFCSCSRTSVVEKSLGRASKLEIWWRPGPEAKLPGSIVYRLFTEKETLCWQYGGGVEDMFMMNADKVVARNTAMIADEKKKGQLRVVFEQLQILAHEKPVMYADQVVVYFFGEGVWDRPHTGSIGGWPILQGGAFPTVTVDAAKDTLAATIELDAPARERIKRQRDRGGPPGP